MIKTQIQCEISIPPSQGNKRIGAEIRELTLAKNPRLWVMSVFPCHPWNWRVCKDNNNDRAGNLLLFAPFFILILQARWKKDHQGAKLARKFYATQPLYLSKLLKRFLSLLDLEGPHLIASSYFTLFLCKILNIPPCLNQCLVIPLQTKTKNHTHSCTRAAIGHNLWSPRLIDYVLPW